MFSSLIKGLGCNKEKDFSMEDTKIESHSCPELDFVMPALNNDSEESPENIEPCSSHIDTSESGREMNRVYMLPDDAGYENNQFASSRRADVKNKERGVNGTATPLEVALQQVPLPNPTDRHYEVKATVAHSIHESNGMISPTASELVAVEKLASETQMEIQRKETDSSPKKGIHENKRIDENKEEHPCDSLEDCDEGFGHPYIGKEVKILHGPGAGIEATIIRIKSPGWWILNHPDLDGKAVKSSSCQMVHSVSDDKMIEYSAKRGIQWCKSQTNALQNQEKHENGEVEYLSVGMNQNNTYLPKGASTRINVPFPLSDEVQLRQSLPQQDCDEGESNESDSKRVRLDVGESIKMSDIMDAARSPNGLYCLSPSNLKEEQCLRPKFGVLPPICIASDGRMDTLPHGLRHLGCTTKVKLFDRKTGKILEGDEAVEVQHLNSVLQQHAEFEPIIPPPNFASGQTIVRQGRSGRRIRVGSDVAPQRKMMTSELSGREVTILDGPHRGSRGKIHAILEGGWYAVVGIIPQLQLIIGPSNFIMEPLSSEDASHQESLSPPNLEEYDQSRAEFMKNISQHYVEEVSELKKQLKVLIEEEKTLQIVIKRVNTTGSRQPVDDQRKRQLAKQLDYLMKCRKELEQELAQCNANRNNSIGLVDKAFSDDEKKSRDELT